MKDKKSQVIQLDDNYRILYDENNVILQHHEIKIRTKLTGEKVDHEFTENYYYPNIKMCLKSYCNKSLKYSLSITEILDRIKKLEIKIDKVLSYEKIKN
jgi:hypothetical protein